MRNNLTYASILVILFLPPLPPTAIPNNILTLPMNTMLGKIPAGGGLGSLLFRSRRI
jgi:hypothetical protein